MLILIVVSTKTLAHTKNKKQKKHRFQRNLESQLTNVILFHFTNSVFFLLLFIIIYICFVCGFHFIVNAKIVSVITLEFLHSVHPFGESLILLANFLSFREEIKITQNH